MASKWLPRDDDGLRAFAVNFGTELGADPQACSLTSADAERYATLAAAFDRAMLEAYDPAFAGPMRVRAKRIARAALEEATRRYAAVVRASLTTTPQLLERMGLPQRKDPARAGGAPTEVPQLMVAPTATRALDVTLTAHASGRRPGKPKSAAGAVLFYWMGEGERPSALADWRLHGLTGRTRVRVEFANHVAPGTAVWFTATWFGPTFEQGQAAIPVCGRVGFGGMRLAA